MCPFDDDAPDAVKPKAIALWHEHQELKTKAEALSAERDAMQARIAELERQVATKNKKLFGKTSERRPGGGANDTAQAKPTHEADAKPGHGPRAQPHLERETTEHVLPESERTCTACGGKLEKWQDQFEDSTEVDAEPRRYVERLHRRQKYRCRCGACIKTAKAPEKLKEGNRYSIFFAVDVAAEKYAMHLPLERQVQAMLRSGLAIDSQTLWDQVDSVAFWALGAYRLLGEHVRSQPVIGGDETTWRLMTTRKDEGASTKWWIWLARASHAVVYAFEDSRSADAGGKLFDGYAGVVVCDGYVAYRTLRTRNPGLVLAHCWSHIRRDYLDIRDAYPTDCTPMLSAIDELFAIERETKHLTAVERLTIRRARSEPVLERIAVQAFAIGLSNAKESRIYTATKTLALQWEGLTRFLSDGRIPIHNNGSEQSARGPVLGRKNHQGSRSKRGTEVAAILYTLVESAKLSGIDPRAYLHVTVLRALRGQAPVLPADVTRAMLVDTCGMSEAQAGAAINTREVAVETTV